jgi:hypothetical protein
MQENFSKEDSLLIIESMVRKAKNQFSENGHLYLLWGWTVFICSLSQFILMYFFQLEKAYMVWALTWIMVIYQFFYLRKKIQRNKVRTYTEEIMGYVWLVFFILMVLTGFIAGRYSLNNPYFLLDTVFLALYGMPTFLSGVILRFRPLVYGGIFCWALSVISTFIEPHYHLLLVALAMIAGWIIPGYQLRSRYKLQTNL